MTSNTVNVGASAGWSTLQQLAADAAAPPIAELLSANPQRVENYSLTAAGIYLDYSKNRMSDAVRAALLALADAAQLRDSIEAMFRGEAINNTEQRAVLHTALRADTAVLARDGLVDISAKIVEQKRRMREISEAIRSGGWRGSSGEAITDVINLGIGGSDLGPRLVCDALKEFAHPALRLHFIANVDGEVINSTLRQLNPATTLVIVASKTFTTQETLLNAGTAAAWFREKLHIDNPYASAHFIGITAAPENARKLGIAADNILEFWDWVGGRYSLWSSIGLAIAIAVGFENFEGLLAGARQMDAHFRTAPWSQNMPVLLALLGIWYTNFQGAESHAVIPYCERLFNLPFYLQQLDMESNGKSVTRDGRAVSYRTGPVIWGLTGTNGQHSFFQLLHQGTHLIPVDFIGVLRDAMSAPDHHRVLLANMLAQAAALMSGKQSPELPPYRTYPGNRPSNVLLLDALTPESLGALIALYEHKVFVQGCLWNINSFDQWGVELGKALAGNLLREDLDTATLDSSTRQLLARVRAAQRENR